MSSGPKTDFPSMIEYRKQTEGTVKVERCVDSQKKDGKESSNSANVKNGDWSDSIG